MARSKGYKIVKKWKRLPVYGCNSCSFESMKEEVLKNHVAMVHKRRRPVENKQQFDRFGVPIRTQIEAPMKKGG